MRKPPDGNIGRFFIVSFTWFIEFTGLFRFTQRDGEEQVFAKAF